MFVHLAIRFLMSWVFLWCISYIWLWTVLAINLIRCHNLGVYIKGWHFSSEAIWYILDLLSQEPWRAVEIAAVLSIFGIFKHRLHNVKHSLWGSCGRNYTSIRAVIVALLQQHLINIYKLTNKVTIIPQRAAKQPGVVTWISFPTWSVYWCLVQTELVVPHPDSPMGQLRGKNSSIKNDSYKIHYQQEYIEISNGKKTFLTCHRTKPD